MVMSVLILPTTFYSECVLSSSFNPLTPMSDQGRISPYNINTISSRQVMRIKKILIRRLLVDPIPNSPNQHHKNYMADSKVNYW